MLLQIFTSYKTNVCIIFLSVSSTLHESIKNFQNQSCSNFRYLLYKRSYQFASYTGGSPATWKSAIISKGQD